MAEELPRVVGWALEGARRVLEQGGFTESPISGEIVERWRLSADAVAEFFADSDVVLRRDDAHAPRKVIYEVFRSWCKEAERKPLGTSKFYERVEGLGYLFFKDSAGVRRIRGVELV